MPEETPTREAEIATALVHRIAAGDVAAEGELVARYSRGLLSLLRRRSGRPDLAEDLHQETFRVVLERLRSSGLEDPGRLVGFLHRTARNLFLGEVRKKARRRTDEDDGQGMAGVRDPHPGPLDSVLVDEEASLVRQLLEELRPERARQILYRFYIIEDPKERICADLELSSLHFNRVLYDARKRLKVLFEQHEKRRRLMGATRKAA